MSDLEIAHIWAAKFSCEDEQEDIFEELDCCGNGQEPISKFAESQNEWFYDHDFFYIADKNEFFLSNDIEEVNLKKINDEWSNKIPKDYLCVIVGDEEDFKNPKSCSIHNSEIIYVGKFEHWS